MADQEFKRERAQALSDRVGNVYLFSAAQGSVIAATGTRGIEGEDLFSYLELPDSERSFVDERLLEDVTLPITVIGRCGGEDRAIMILRKMVFQTSICIALEFFLPAAEILCFLCGRELDGIVSSPLSRKLVNEYGEKKALADGCIASSCMAREVIALGDVSLTDRLSNASALEDLVSCIRNVVEIDVRLELANTGIDIRDCGRVFANGFCICTVLSLAMAAKKYSSDSAMRIAAFCDNGYPILDISYSAAKKGVWRGDAMLTSIAEAYGIPLEIRALDGTVRCRIIPEYPDEALEGVKADILFGSHFYDSFDNAE